MTAYTAFPYDHRRFVAKCRKALAAIEEWPAGVDCPEREAKEFARLLTANEEALAELDRHKPTPGAIRMAAVAARDDLERSLVSLLYKLWEYPVLGNLVCMRMNLVSTSELWPPPVPGSEAPTISAGVSGRKVTIRFRDRRGNDKPRWAGFASIYRRKAGRKDFELVANALRSPHVDEITGGSGEYEYMARFRSIRTSGPSPDSEIVRVKVSAARAA